MEVVSNCGGHFCSSVFAFRSILYTARIDAIKMNASSIVKCLPGLIRLPNPKDATYGSWTLTSSSPPLSHLSGRNSCESEYISSSWSIALPLISKHPSRKWEEGETSPRVPYNRRSFWYPILCTRIQLSFCVPQLSTIQRRSKQDWMGGYRIPTSRTGLQQSASFMIAST